MDGFQSLYQESVLFTQQSASQFKNRTPTENIYPQE